jgi:thymidylate kinase
LQQGGIVLADRYGFDVAQRDASSLAHHPSLARLLPRIFPRPDLTYLLWEEPEVLHRRKAERSVEDSAALLERLRRTLAEVPTLRQIRTDEPPARIANRIATEICEVLEARCPR